MEITFSNTNVMSVRKHLEKKKTTLNMKSTTISDYIVENVIYFLNPVKITRKFVKIQTNHSNLLESLKKVKIHKSDIVLKGLKNF